MSLFSHFRCRSFLILDVALFSFQMSLFSHFKRRSFLILDCASSLHYYHVVADVLGDFRGAQVRVLQEAVRDADERVLGPGVKPVDARAVHQAGKTARTDPEHVAHYTTDQPSGSGSGTRAGIVQGGGGGG
jgi:hypothetical protein